MSASQVRSSSERERSFEKIESKTGRPGRLEIMCSKDGNGRFVTLLTGDLKGHKITLKCDSQRGPVLGGRLNDQEHFSGTVDGADLDMHEARDLWVRYAGMAYDGEEWMLPNSRKTSGNVGDVVRFLLES